MSKKPYPAFPDPTHPDYHPDGSPSLWGTLDYGSCEDPAMHEAGWYGPWPPINYNEPIESQIKRHLGDPQKTEERLRLLFEERVAAFWLLQDVRSLLGHETPESKKTWERGVDEWLARLKKWEDSRDLNFPWATKG